MITVNKIKEILLGRKQSDQKKSLTITRQEVENILKDLSYKSGYTFQHLYISDLVCGISLIANVPNSCGAGERTSVIANKFWSYYDVVNRFIDREYIINSVFALITELEEHETKEWFKVQGKHFIDPHPPDEKIGSIRSIEEWKAYSEKNLTGNHYI